LVPTINDIKAFLDKNGFLSDDPRWSDCIDELYSHDKINESIYLEILKERFSEIRMAIDKELSITDFQTYTGILDEIYKR
jgi:hypothetical protein